MRCLGRRRAGRHLPRPDKQTFSIKLVAQAFDKVTEGDGIDPGFDPATVRVTALTVKRDTTRATWSIT